MIKPPKTMRHVDDLKAIMDALLSPQGCPWDREQTPKSITPNMIEEAYEAAEAIEDGDVEAIKEELGDVLLQVVFQSAMAERLGQFKFDDVVQTLNEKLVRRHAHVFGDVKAGSADEALKSWDNVKKSEKKGGDDPLGVSQSLPALQRAHKIGSKTKTLQFDWDGPDAVFEKVDEELAELRAAYKNGDQKGIEEELGDLFFVVAQLSRHLKVEAETATRAANRKFEKRFKRLLERAKSKNLDFKTLSLEEKERLWQEIKKDP